MERAVTEATVRYDRAGDQHYDVISAFIKSIRGSDPDAALHYLARMLVAGEDPRFVARRLMVHASEDVGLADPTALPAAVAAAQVVQLVGLPEARIALAQVTVHLATAPKSNAVVTAIDAAMADVRAGAAGPVPPHLRDGHYAGAQKLGNAVGYRYPHDVEGAVLAQQYPPDALVGRDYYRPTTHGAERVLAERLPKLRRVVRGERQSRRGQPSRAWRGVSQQWPRSECAEPPMRSAACVGPVGHRVALDRAAHAPRAAAAAAQLPARDLQHLDAVRAQVGVGRLVALVGDHHPRRHRERVAPVVPLLALRRVDVLVRGEHADLAAVPAPRRSRRASRPGRGR